LELIDTDTTSPGLIPILTEFFEKRVGKRVVRALDTPGFIANRYGMWSMYHAVHIAEKLQLRIEDVDTITGAFLGRPRSGSFRLNDIVGIDVMESIAQNQLARCENDPFIGTLTAPRSIKHLIEQKHLGNKSGKGYYERVGKEFFALDFQTLAYRPIVDDVLKTVAAYEKLPIGERIREALNTKDEVGEFLRLYLVPALRYADYLKSEVCYSIHDFDNVMKWGFGWTHGPFELIDAIGPELILEKTHNFYEKGTQLGVHGHGYVAVPNAPEFRALTDYPVCHKHGELVFRDLGDEVQSIEYSTKMGSVSPTVVRDFLSFLDSNPSCKYVLASSAKAFSVGFDLRFFQDCIEREDWMSIIKAISELQQLGERLEKFPIVSAVHGYCLGGGFEIAMSCPRLVALSDAQIGLPEAKVGLIPGGRGAINVRLRNQLWIPALRNAIIDIAEGTIWSNAPEALAHGLLRQTDEICFHPDRLIQTAKEMVLELDVDAYKPFRWEPVGQQIVGMVDQDIQSRVTDGRFTAYDEHIAQHLKALACKSKSYDDALSTEQERFLELCKRPETKARIDHMLETSKPLRN
ncbi:MAG TPA: 3-hydroxyacyl-CoA dehydrogenase family protein, partial [Fimbriimonas sp.]|nr:3-hydroxyacyl-CoA dehydrogenase family protein [Fimbriimonas sp.]